MLKHYTKYYDKAKTKIKEEYWRFKQKYHREDGPAVILYFPNGNVKRFSFYLNGELSGCSDKSTRYYGATHIDFHDNGNINRIIYDERLCNELDPMMNEYYSNGKIKRSVWFKGYLSHRIEAPAIIHYSEDGLVTKEEYYFNGKLHNLNGPACINYYSNKDIHGMGYSIHGVNYSFEDWLEIRQKYITRCTVDHYDDDKTQIARKSYYKGFYLHKEDGPAVIYFDLEGTMFAEFYYLNGEYLSKQEWLEAVETI